MIDWTPYQKYYNHETLCFTSKAAATHLAATLAAELRLSIKSFIVEGKKGEYHLLCSYASRYWMPSKPFAWDQELRELNTAVRRANTDD